MPAPEITAFIALPSEQSPCHARETSRRLPGVRGRPDLRPEPFRPAFPRYGKTAGREARMKTSLAQKIVNATLLLGPIVAAFVAAAAVRAGEPGPTVTITS